MVFGLSAFSDSAQLMPPEALEFAGPLVQRPDRFCIGSVELLAADAALMHQADFSQNL